MTNENFFNTGAISGAITDPYSDDAVKHAQLYYEEIRHSNTDVLRISQNTEFSFEQILLVKNYLFMDLHSLEGKIKRFDPTFEIAESWRRLAFDSKNIKPHDITLLKHELKEIELINKGYSQSRAHNITSKYFNYAKESEAYYNSIGFKLKRFNENQEADDRNSGAISQTKDWKERY